MPKSANVPKTLRPYLFHGVSIGFNEGDEEAIGDCPWCGRDGKFSVKVATGQWRCFVCAEGTEKGGGNVDTFLKLLWEASDKVTNGALPPLAKDKLLLYPETLMFWGVVKSSITGEWLVPGYNAERKLKQLYKYILVEGSRKLLPTPELGHQVFLPTIYDDKKPNVYLCEGPWDGMSLWETLRCTKKTETGYTLTANEGNSLYAASNVVAIPGCGSVGSPLEKLLPLFAGKVVYLLFDSDHPKENNGKKAPSAGYDAMKRATAILAKAEESPKEIHWLKWGEEGFDPSKKSGFDVRDWLSSQKTPTGRVMLLPSLLDKLAPIPEDWIAGRSKLAASKGSPEINCITCSSWKTLVNTWRKAMKWTEGLDRAMSVMLACVTSTKALGDQLWCKIMGPASCLDGSTPIYDPLDKSTKTVEERQKEGKKFSVYSLKKNNIIGICTALPPQKYPAEMLYEVQFSSGKVMRVTGGHRFWNGFAYVSLSTIVDALRESASYPLPTISDTALLTRERDAFHWRQTAQDSQYGCHAYSCSCGGLLPLVRDNGQYVSPSLNGVPRRNLRKQRRDGFQLLEKCNHRHKSLPSNYLSGNREGAYKVSNQFPSLRDDALSSFCSCENAYNNLLSPLHDSTFLLVRQPLSQSSGDGFLLPVPLESCRRGPDPLLGFEQFAPESYRKDRDEHTPESSPDSIQEILPDGTLFQPSGDTFEVPRSQRSLSHSTEREFCQKDKDQQPAYDAQETKQQPYVTPIRVSKVNIGPIILTETDDIVNVKPLGEKEYFDFHVPETNNYWACGFFHHNCGKSTLCEALSINKKYVFSKSSIRGFHSGWKTDKEGEEDHGLVPKIRDKTLVTKDGDTLLQSPNLSQILSEARDLYDSTARVHYRHGLSRDHEGVRWTWLLCGTASLRSLDSSELGERFLDCVIMEGIDDDLEDEILWRVANRATRGMSFESDGKMETQHDPDLVKAMQLTGGYVDHLRTNAKELLSSVIVTDEALQKCVYLGKFVAYMRARPSIKQDESAEREFATRLVSQMTRLAQCLAVVLNKKELDKEVMRRVTAVAMDTARGRVLELAKHLYKSGKEGSEVKGLALLTNQTEDKERGLLRFMRRIGVAETYVRKTAEGVTTRPKWRLTERLRDLYKKVVTDKEKEKV